MLPTPERATTSTDPRGSRTSDWVRNSKLALACAALFLVFWAAQSLTGWRVDNEDRTSHGAAEIGYVEYLTTGHFMESTFENWESEFLQMGAFVLLTTFLVQKGSAESRRESDDPHDEDPGAHRNDPGAPWPVHRGGVWLLLYQNSLLLAFVVLFLGSIVGHAVGGVREHNEELVAHGDPPVNTWVYVGSSQFWFESFQNWQSEFLAVGSIVVLTIVLRQKGSPESKPVHAPTDRTGD
jgi:hypothetical protein